jgi:hypothetical protein
MENNTVGMAKKGKVTSTLKGGSLIRWEAKEKTGGGIHTT